MSIRRNKHKEDGRNAVYVQIHKKVFGLAEGGQQRKNSIKKNKIYLN